MVIQDCAAFWTVALISMCLGLAACAGILVHGRKHVQAGLPGHAKPTPLSAKDDRVRTEKVAMIVPVTGSSPDMRACLESLLSQDYPDFEVNFVSANAKDPATALVRTLVDQTKNSRHILAGAATGCAQKNHNLLAGVTATGTTADILVFCDSSHMAPPTLLGDLIRPMVKEGAVLTTGFHRILPGDLRPATLGMLLTVMTIHLLQGNRAFTQPWGGATAIRRSVFEKHRVDRLWETAIVDDFSMGPYLRRFGIRCIPVSTACLDTPLSNETLPGWSAWLTRQLLYMKFCIPGAWMGAAIGAYLLAGPLVLAPVCLMAALLGTCPWPLGAAGLFYLIVFAGFGMTARKLAPRPLPIGKWLVVFYTAPFMAFWCYLKTWSTNIVKWKGISYRVAFGGKVREIILEERE